MITVPLSAPLNLDGVEIIEVKLDPARMNGRGIIAAERAAVAAASGVPIVMRALDAGFLAHLAAHAAKLDAEKVLDMPGRDFETVTGAVRSFLLGTD